MSDLFCKDCRHYRSGGGDGFSVWYAKCDHPSAPKAWVKVVSKVHGPTEQLDLAAAMARECSEMRSTGVCGPDGKLWERRRTFWEWLTQ